jgi:hypothetical protein
LRKAAAGELQLDKGSPPAGSHWTPGSKRGRRPTATPNSADGENASDQSPSDQRYRRGRKRGIEASAIVAEVMKLIRADGVVSTPHRSWCTIIKFACLLTRFHVFARFCILVSPSIFFFLYI